MPLQACIQCIRILSISHACIQCIQIQFISHACVQCIQIRFTSPTSHACWSRNRWGVPDRRMGGLPAATLLKEILPPTATTNCFWILSWVLIMNLKWNSKDNLKAFLRVQTVGSQYLLLNQTVAVPAGTMGKREKLTKIRPAESGSNVFPLWLICCESCDQLALPGSFPNHNGGCAHSCPNLCFRQPHLRGLQRNRAV